MYYKVANAIHAVANVDDYSGSARQWITDRAASRLFYILCLWYLSCFCPRLLAATTLRNVLGTMNLGEILSQRESIAREMRVRYTELLYGEIISHNAASLRRRWTMPRCPGGSRWRGSRWRMSGFLSNWWGPWQRRLRPPGRPGPRWSPPRGSTEPRDLWGMRPRLSWTAQQPFRWEQINSVKCSNNVCAQIRRWKRPWCCLKFNLSWPTIQKCHDTC